MLDLENLIYYHIIQMRNYQEYAKCNIDPIYFFEKYCEVLTEDGIQPIKIRSFQKEIIKDYFTNRFNITANSRQTGINTVINLLMLYDAIFNTVKSIMLIEDKFTEEMDIIMNIYLKLPHFLKPGIVEYNHSYIQFDNGSIIRTMRKNCDLSIGFGVDSLFLNDFAYIHPTMAKNIMNSMFPIMKELKDCKIFISSSPNGINHFTKLLMDAERKDGDPKKNEFKPHRVYWWEVSGRDEQWKNNETLKLGSSDIFDQAYDLMFFKYNDI